MTATGLSVVTSIGQTYDIMFSANVIVRFQDGTSEVGTSAIADEMMVTVVGYLTGLPSRAKMRANLIVINNSVVNQEILSAS